MSSYNRRFSSLVFCHKKQKNLCAFASLREAFWMLSRRIKMLKPPKWLFYVFLVQTLLFCSSAPGETSQQSIPSESLISYLKLATPLTFCGEPVPIDNREVKERFEKEFLLSLGDRPQVILWLKRSSRYLPYIAKMLKKNGLPDDLKYVAVAESALKPHAGSRKGAMGFWQFMRQTGRRYGLTINRRIDERRNIFASTGAAIKYFKDLYEEFGSWTLAAAAYNMGEKGLMSEILEQQTDDYYQLYLSLETQRFLFRILSIKAILSEPEKFGFKLQKDDYYRPLAFDKVRVKSVGNVPCMDCSRGGQDPLQGNQRPQPGNKGAQSRFGNS